MNEHQQVSKFLLQKNHLVHLDPNPKEPSGPPWSHSKRTIWSIWVSLKENHFLAALGSGALLSSNLEEALYKFT